MGTTSYSKLRENLAEIWDKVEDSQEPVIVERRGHQTMAILPAEELEGLRETAHLLRSPRNAARLLTALQRALRGQTKSIALEDLRAELAQARDPEGQAGVESVRDAAAIRRFHPVGHHRHHPGVSSATKAPPKKFNP